VSITPHERQPVGRHVAVEPRADGRHPRQEQPGGERPECRQRHGQAPIGFEAVISSAADDNGHLLFQGGWRKIEAVTAVVLVEIESPEIEQFESAEEVQAAEHAYGSATQRAGAVVENAESPPPRF
jgi:hypothetical protein